jgi:hypothetical protein
MGTMAFQLALVAAAVKGDPNSSTGSTSGSWTSRSAAGLSSRACRVWMDLFSTVGQPRWLAPQAVRIANLAAEWDILHPAGPDLARRLPILPWLDAGLTLSALHHRATETKHVPHIARRGQIVGAFRRMLGQYTAPVWPDEAQIRTWED